MSHYYTTYNWLINSSTYSHYYYNTFGNVAVTRLLPHICDTTIYNVSTCCRL